METRERAEHILKLIESIYVPTHNFVTVDVKQFRHLDLAYYDKVQRYLEGQGFVLICNKEDVTLSEAQGSILDRILIRVLASADGKISAAIYHPKIKSFWLRALLFVMGQRVGRVVDFESEFTDGTFICTTNAEIAGKISLPKHISSEFMPRNTPTCDLLVRHKAKLEARCNESGIGFRLVRNYDENISMQNRMNALKAAYRGEIGGITKEELDKLAPQHADLNDEVLREMEKIRNHNG